MKKKKKREMKQLFTDIGQPEMWDGDSFERENKYGEHYNYLGL